MRPSIRFLNRPSSTLLTVVTILCCLTQCSHGISSQALTTFRYLLPSSFEESGSPTIKNGPNSNPVIFVPGDGGSQLEAKLNKTKVPHYMCSKISDWFDLWLNIHLLAPRAIDCLFDNLKLNYDNKTRTTRNTEGVQIRVANFGSLKSVDYLDIYHIPYTDYFDKIITTLIKNNGYTYDVDMVGAGFDFRKAPNELTAYFDDLKMLIESHYINNNYRPVTLICHSMGCLNSLYLLNREKKNWKEVYVKRLIALAAPWGGSFKAITAMLYGDNLGIPLLDKYKLQALQSTFPSLMYLFPRAPTFQKNRTLVETPTKNYTLENLDELFVDAKLFDQREMWHDTKAIAGNLTAPDVELWCLYGITKYNQTPSKVIFKESLQKFDYSEIEGEGDGTVNIESLRACEYFSQQQTKPVYTRMFYDVDHINILRGSDAADFISTEILKE